MLGVTLVVQDEQAMEGLRYAIGHLRLGWKFEPRLRWPSQPPETAPNGCRPSETSGHFTLLQRIQKLQI